MALFFLNNIDTYKKTLLNNINQIVQNLRQKKKIVVLLVITYYGVIYV